MSSAVTPPRYAISENALRLIAHAKDEISTASYSPGKHGRISAAFSGHGPSPDRWLPETAFLRLVSVVEAYIDLISMNRMSRLVDTSQPLVQILVSDFEISSSSNWDDRHDVFERYHGFSMKALAGWQEVAAGIEVRNCLAHGLGRLTARQRSKTSLAAKIGVIDVSVASNQMHLADSSVPKLADACANLVRAIDGRISIPAGP